MSYEETAPVADKILHADGSVTTSAGGIVLPADPDRAKEYESRAAAVDKWLRQDGSIVDMSGRVILDADESRAKDYESRAANAGSFLALGIGSPGFQLTEKENSFLMPFAHGDDAVRLDIFALDDGENTYLLPYAAVHPGEDNVDPNYCPITDTVSAVLE